MKEIIKPGSIVNLKGQEISMAVAEVKEDIITCIWFDIENKLNRFDFYIHDLEVSILD